MLSPSVKPNIPALAGCSLKISEQRVQTFGELLKTQNELYKKQSDSVTMGNIDAIFGGKSDMLNFENF